MKQHELTKFFETKTNELDEKVTAIYMDITAFKDEQAREFASFMDKMANEFKEVKETLKKMNQQARDSQ